MKSVFIVREQANELMGLSTIVLFAMAVRTKDNRSLRYCKHCEESFWIEPVLAAEEKQ